MSRCFGTGAYVPLAPKPAPAHDEVFYFTMVHIYNIHEAVEYGVCAATLLQNFRFWISHNRANRLNFHEGRYWTYNSKKAYSELFPEYTPSQIRRGIERLCEEQILVTGNFNKMKTDRTMWYAFYDESLQLSFVKSNNTHSSSTSNPFVTGDKCIPDKNQISTTDDIPPNPLKGEPARPKKNRPVFDPNLEEVTPGPGRDLILEWLAYRKEIGKPYKSQMAVDRMVARLKKMAGGSFNKAREIIDQAMSNQWTGFFELKTERRNGKDRTSDEILEEAYRLAKKYGGSEEVI